MREVAAARLSTRPVSSRPRVLSRSWVAVALLALIVASDYQWRTRSPEAALSGTVDIAILTEVGVYGLVAAFVVLFVADPPRGGRLGSVLGACWGWTVVSLVSAAWSPYRAMAGVRGLQLVVVALTVTAAARHATREHLHRLAHAYVVVVTLSVAFGLAFPFPRTPRQASRFNWLHVHPVIAATFCGIAVVILTAYLLMRREDLPWRWPRGAYGGLLLLHAVAVVATITRGAMAATALGCLVVATMVSDTRRRVDLAVVALVAGVVVVLLFGDSVMEFLRRGQTDVAFRTLSARTVLWTQAWELFREQPLRGYGLMAARGLFLDETGLGSAHNALIETAINSGLLGAVLWLALLGVIAWQLYDQWTRAGRRHPDVPLLAGLLVFLVVNGMLTEGPGLPANVQSTWLLAVAAWTVIARREASAPAMPSGSRVPSLP